MRFGFQPLQSHLFRGFGELGGRDAHQQGNDRENNIHGSIAHRIEHMSENRRHNGPRQPKHHVYDPRHKPPSSRVPALYRCEGRDIDETGAKTYQESPQVKHKDIRGKSQLDHTETADYRPDGYHASCAKFLLPVAHKEHKDSHSSQHEK